MRTIMALSMTLLLYLGLVCLAAATTAADVAAAAAPDSQQIWLTAEGSSSQNKYIEYYEGGGLPLILASPHGGLESPPDIPDREAGCWDNSASSCVWQHDCGEKNFTKCRAVTVTDGYTADLTREIRQHLCRLFHGLCPGVVINLLNRTKLDANRGLEEASFSVPAAVDAFNAFHSYINKEKERLEGGAREGRGLFIDIHGQNHAIERAEVGYLVRGSDLDSGLPISPTNTSIKALAAWMQGRVSFDEILRGNASFGAMLEAAGYRAVPSPTDRGPGGEVYFNGGYNTRQHGSWKGGRVDGIQIESAHNPRMPPNRARYSRALSCAIARYICLYYSEFINVTSLVTSSSSSDMRLEKDGAEWRNDYESADGLCEEIQVECRAGGLKLTLLSFLQYGLLIVAINIIRETFNIL